MHKPVKRSFAKFFSIRIMQVKMFTEIVFVLENVKRKILSLKPFLPTRKECFKSNQLELKVFSAILTNISIKT